MLADRQYTGTQIILGNVASPGRLDRPHLVVLCAGYGGFIVYIARFHVSKDGWT